MDTILNKNIILIITFMLLTGLAYANQETHLNEGLPVMVDSNTELNDIRLHNMTVTFTYKIKGIELEEALQERKARKVTISQNACNDEALQDLLHKDLNVEFVYCLNKQKVLQVNLDQQFCQKINDQLVTDPSLSHLNIQNPL